MRSKRNKNNKERLCVAGLLLLVIAALFLPQIIFEIQDKYRMVNTEVESRESLDISQLNLSYEKQLGTRMSNFLKANQKMVTGLDYEVTKGSEQADLLENIWYQEWFYIVIDYGVNTGIDYYTKMFEIDFSSCVQDCKKYIVYGSNYERMLMMWYFDIYLADIDTRMQLVVDSETDTIYYMKLSYGEPQVKKTKLAEAYYFMYDYILSYIDFYYSYYEADNGTNAETNINADTWNEAEDITAKMEVGEQYDAGVIMDENQYKVEMALPYGETSMTFLFQAVFGDGIYPDIVMGIREIGELIPEMMQD